ncbi:MAG: hypothetical protein JO131_04020 [Gammaproteobacteria bacterium]|nr:hypothetical protein [Gammaproteobacteria bacterium]
MQNFENSEIKEKYVVTKQTHALEETMNQLFHLAEKNEEVSRLAISFS